MGIVTALCLGSLGILASENFLLSVYSLHPGLPGGLSLNSLHLAHGAFESWVHIIPAKPFVASLILGSLLTVCIDQRERNPFFSFIYVGI